MGEAMGQREGVRVQGRGRGGPALALPGDHRPRDAQMGGLERALSMGCLCCSCLLRGEMLLAPPGVLFLQLWVSGTERWAPAGWSHVPGDSQVAPSLSAPSSSSSICWDRPSPATKPVPAAFGDCPRAPLEPSRSPAPALPGSCCLSSLSWVRRRGRILHRAG